MIRRCALLWRTVRHLRVQQVIYQVWNRLRPASVVRLPAMVPAAYWLRVPTADKPVSRKGQAFSFLNQTVVWDDPGQIDWNYAANGKLWTYNLTYFDCLNQPDVPPGIGLAMIRSFINQTDRITDGLEPYPTSLRIMNWVQFLSRHQIQDELVQSHLYAQVSLLRGRLEYHLAGNHLLENGFALLIAALFFQKRIWFQTAATLVRQELTAQVLTDGGHDERSPMYHQILLDRLLDVCLAVGADPWHGDPTFAVFLNQKAALMLGWLEAVTFSDGSVPMVNDAAEGIAPSTAQLRRKAELTGVSTASVKLGESGYRLIRQGRHELFVDVGAVGPDHQPGHAHADTFSFILYVDGLPVLVDPGTSTYQLGDQRQWERSTRAHNTVTPQLASDESPNSSEVWSGFRVGRRARVTLLDDTDTSLIARHNGYRRLGLTHQRSWQMPIHDQFVISDQLTGYGTKTGVARFYIHPRWAVDVQVRGVKIGPIQITFQGEAVGEVTTRPYAMAAGFNRLQPARCLVVLFTGSLQTTVTITP
ncbi:heparinase II/III family protein [Fibrisoma limi BUZ 3]|uniref:Heparinase II/III family protein n=1 Tax=Fibrisoma limi BUZ 3 TaxID=1185876 RepID=I2GCJ3_9BACT|nr:alginate lyase family protein [Fibrisoma limi]CCH51617.1 heparinase II/III family protein [Fibrisoma limi BUZ 3]